MPSLVLKPTHKPVKNYYAALQQLAAQGATHEGAVKTAFQGLLEACASQRQWTLLGAVQLSVGLALFWPLHD